MRKLLIAVLGRSTVPSANKIEKPLGEFCKALRKSGTPRKTVAGQEQGRKICKRPLSPRLLPAFAFQMLQGVHDCSKRAVRAKLSPAV